MLEGDEDLLHRVVVNLVLNAVQAARGAACVVTVRVGMCRPVNFRSAPTSRTPVRLEVATTAPASPKSRDRLFEPFVIGPAGGSGLGLAIVQRAVEAHRGLVSGRLRAGAGTTFTIYFPPTPSAEGVA